MEAPMAWWIETLEIADEGKPTGTFRKTARSDEDGGGPFGLCDHAHSSKEEADECPEAVTRAEAF
jgi:hypothetical protein